MKIYLGKSGLKKSFQKEFKPTIRCSECEGKARIIFVGQEGDEGKGNYICDLRKNGGKGNYWFHDVISIAVYLCKDCFYCEAIVNQA